MITADMQFSEPRLTLPFTKSTNYVHEYHECMKEQPVDHDTNKRLTRFQNLEASRVS